MKSGNFIELSFVVKGELQVEYINVEHVSRIMHGIQTIYWYAGTDLHAPDNRRKLRRPNERY